MQVRGPMGGCGTVAELADVEDVGVEVVVEGAGEAGCTGTGIQPPGAWVTVADSRFRRWGIDGPVRSMSRMPTEWEAWVRVRASCVVTEDLPTPPLPERICGVERSRVSGGGGGEKREVGSVECGPYQDDVLDAGEGHRDRGLVRV